MTTSGNNLFKMTDLVSPAVVGSTGILGTVEIGRVNTWLGTAIALITIASMLPIAISRWQKLLEKKQLETIDPFKK